MADKGKVLLADDEENFQRAIAVLLREQGYLCDVVSDASAATERLRHNQYDVLIADIKMPGNTELEFIRELSADAQGISMILVTGYPSTETAIASVELPILAYLVKPFKFEDLLTHVRFGVERSKAYHAVERLREHVQEWKYELEGNGRVLSQATSQSFSDPLGVFLQTSFLRVILILSELETVAAVLVRHEGGGRNIVFNDPRLDLLMEVLVDAVAILEKTKHAFKSKDLGMLRKRLETLIARVDVDSRGRATQ